MGGAPSHAAGRSLPPSTDAATPDEAVREGRASGQTRRAHAHHRQSGRAATRRRRLRRGEAGAQRCRQRGAPSAAGGQPGRTDGGKLRHAGRRRRIACRHRDPRLSPMAKSAANIEKAKGGAGLALKAAIAILGLAALTLVPLVLVLIPGMMPTFVTLLIDRQRLRYLSY